MKRWKLSLALVLALAMLFSLALTAHAEGEPTFTDERRITQKMPVTVLSGLGIINGYPDGSFRPAAPISRAEFCKMLATMDNAGKEMTTDYSAALTFTDTVDHPLRSSIGYCVAMKYASGKNEQTFDPEGKVTLLEAARMLLVVLGHDPEVEGFVGETWEENVRVEAHKPRSTLFKNFPEDVTANLEGSLNRDLACRMFFNALTSSVVYSPSGKTTIAGEITIQDKTEITELENETFDYMNRPGEKKLQLVERLFPNLRASREAADEFGRPCDYWVDGNKRIGPFVFREPLFDGEGPITGKSTKAKIGEDPTSLTYYYNGKYTDSADTYDVAQLLGLPDVDPAHYLREHDRLFSGKLSSSWASSMLGVIWESSSYRLGKYGSTGRVAGSASCAATYGTHNEVYYDEETKHVTVCSELIYPARVNKYFPAQLDENGVEIVPAYVSATILSGTISPLADLELTETVTVAKSNDKNALFPASAAGAGSKFDQDEVILLTFGYDVEKAAHVVHKVFRTTSVTGTVSGPLSYSSSSASTVSRFSMNGTKTRYLPIRKSSIFPLRKFNIGDPYIVYLGNVSNYSGTALSTWAFYIEAAAQETSDLVVYVARAGVETDILGEKTYRARLINHRGEAVDVVTDQNYSNLVDCLASFRVNANDQYSLLKVGSSGLGSFTVKQGNAQMNLIPAKSTAISIRGEQDLDYTRERTIIADDSTLFIVGSRANEDEEMIYTAYRGIKNVPDLDSTPYYNFAELNGVASTVFIYENKSATSADSYGMLVKTQKDLFNTYVAGSTGYYEIEAVINDEPKTVQVTPALYESLRYGINLFSGCSTNAEGWLTSVKLLSKTYPITALEPTDKGVLHMNFDENGLGGERFVTHDDLHVYTYSLRDRKASVITSDLLSELGAVETASSLFGANAPTVKKGFYTLHETFEGKPLAGVFIIVD
ncbi:MAG: S-layer homology domain-containing protein [Oscillospiraceae bacterium]|nr:S-layer homology domain-containing protein [Oscillospiraceae bacterium]